MMETTAMTMREARTLYFEDNGFGPSGGYDEPWVDFKLGPIPMPFPNTRARVAAVGHHDLHHVITGYDTSFTGELEIAAWEIAAGCRGYGAAWALNLGGMAAGLLCAPVRVFAAFRRGRRERTTYGDDLDVVLGLTVSEARRHYLAAQAPVQSTGRDVALFAVCSLAGVLVAALLLALALPLAPIGLVTHAFRRPAGAA